MNRSAIKTELLVGDKRREKLHSLGDPLVFLEWHVNFAALVAEVDRLVPRPTSEYGGGRPPYPTETMVLILILKRLHSLSYEQIEYQLLDRMSFQSFCGLTHSASIPDRNTVENRIGLVGVAALFGQAQPQIARHGFIARCGQIIDTTLVPAPKQDFTQEEKAIFEQGVMPSDWSLVKRRQKDLDASWIRKHGKSHYGYKLSVNVDKRHKVIRKIEMSDAAQQDSQHFDFVLYPANTSREVCVDRGYAFGEREQALREAVYWDCIQRKATRKHPLPKRQEQRDYTLAKTRSRVEHIFATIEQMGGKLIRAIGIGRVRFAMTPMAATCNLKRLICLKGARIAPF